MKQLTAILQALGIDKKIIDSITSLTEDQLKDWKPDDVIEQIRGGVKTFLLNDGDFLSSIPEEKIGKDILKKVESGQYARFQNELIEVATKKLGLNDKEILTDDDKKSIKKMAEKIAVAYLNKNNNTEGLQKLQGELSTLQEKLEKSEEEYNTKLNDQIGKEKSSNIERMIKLIARAELSSIDKIKLNVSPSYIVDPIINKIKAKYDADFVLNNDEVSLVQKKNTALNVLDEHKKPLSFGAAIRAVVLEDKLGTEIKEEKPEGNPKKVFVNSNEGNGNDDVVVPDYIKDKIEAVGDVGAGK